MSSLENLKTLAYTLGPFVLPYLYSSYRKYRQSLQANKAVRKPVPRRIGLVLNILVVAAVAALVSAYYALSYEEVITLSGSRIQTPQNVLWERVASKRPSLTLTALDEKLKVRLASADGRCLYLMYGPDTTGNCPFCSSEEPMTLFYYALPGILFPYLLNMVVLGLSTSANVAGKEGKRFRTPVILLGCVAAIVEVGIWVNFDWKKNARVTKSEELVHFYGWARLARGVGIASLDIGLAWFLWATSTNRLMVISAPAKERIDMVLRHLEANSNKMTATGVIRSATIRSEELHHKEFEYRKQEDANVEEMIASETVQKAIQKARSLRLPDDAKLQQDAKGYAETMLAAAGVNPGLEHVQHSTREIDK